MYSVNRISTDELPKPRKNERTGFLGCGIIGDGIFVFNYTQRVAHP